MWLVLDEGDNFFIVDMYGNVKMVVYVGRDVFVFILRKVENFFKWGFLF